MITKTWLLTVKVESGDLTKAQAMDKIRRQICLQGDGTYIQVEPFFKPRLILIPGKVKKGNR